MALQNSDQIHKYIPSKPDRPERPARPSLTLLVGGNGQDYTALGGKIKSAYEHHTSLIIDE